MVFHYWSHRVAITGFHNDYYLPVPAGVAAWGLKLCNYGPPVSAIEKDRKQDLLF